MTRRCFFVGTSAIMLAALHGEPDLLQAGPTAETALAPVDSTRQDLAYSRVIESARDEARARMRIDEGLLGIEGDQGIPDLWVLPVRCALCDSRPVLHELPHLLLADVFAVFCPSCGEANSVTVTCPLVAYQAQGFGPYAPISGAVLAWNRQQERLLEGAL